MKNVIIGCLLVSNIATGAYLGMSWINRHQSKAVNPKKISSVARPTDIRGEISGSIRSRTTHLERCYNQYLATAPGARGSGTIALQWSIDQQGQIGGLELKSNDFDDQRLSNCVLDQVKTWTFSHHSESGPIPVAHRFTFQQKTTANLDF